MKKLLISLFILSSFATSAQITDTLIVSVPFQKVSLINYYTKTDVSNLLDSYLLKANGVTSIANNATKDSLIYYIDGIRYAIPVMANAYSKSQTDSISNLKVDKTTTINGKALSTNITLTKSDIGLSNVDNTTDLNKPISTATQNALDLKASLAGDEAFSGTKTFNGRINIGLNGYLAPNLGGGIVLNNPNTNSYIGVYSDKLFFGDNADSTKFILSDTATFQVPINISSLVNSSGDFVTRNSSTGILGKVSPSQALSDMGGLSSATASSTYATIARLQDSVTYLKGLLAKKLDTSYKQPIGMVYPFMGQVTGDSVTFYFPQSWKDTLAYKVDVWPLAGSPVASSLNKFLGYSVADTLIFKVKGGYSGVINATNQNTGFGYLGFTDAGAQRARGSFNTWLGAHAGSGINYATGGTFIGQNARVSIDSSINVNVIGADALATKNNQTVIGNINTVETKLYGTILSNTDTIAKKKDLVNFLTLKKVSDTLISRNYANDSIAFVDGQLNQWDLYRTAGAVKILTTLPYDTSKFNFIIDNRDGSSANLKLRLTTYTSSLVATVYWGDGDSTVLTGDSAIYHPIHVYASSGYYIGKIRVPVISNLRELYLNDATTTIKIAGIYGLNKLTSLVTFTSNYSSLTSTIVDGLSFPASVTTLALQNNNLTGFNAVVPSLSTLVLQSNKIPSSTAIYIPSTVTTLNLRTQSPGGVTWNSADVNTMLQYIDGKTFNAGAKTLDIRQFAGATPTGAGLTAKTNLTSEGWTVTND